jgi:hypothetical protein
MSQRESGYERKALDQYETPSWVTLALVPHLPEINGVIWEPACGGGKMVAALRHAGFRVLDVAMSEIRLQGARVGALTRIGSAIFLSWVAPRSLTARSSRDFTCR